MGKENENFEINRISEAEAVDLERVGTPEEFDAGHMIYKKGDKADRFFYIKKGRVRMYDSVSSGREITLDVIEAGHIFGESAFGSESRPINVQAVNKVTLIGVDMESLAGLLSGKPDFAIHLLQMCSDTMDRLMNRLREQCTLDRYGKIACFLLDVTSVESPEKGTVGGNVPFTHGDLADYLGLNRTTVSAVLKYFDMKRWISCGYGKIRVIDRESLADFVKSQMS